MKKKVIAAAVTLVGLVSIYSGTQRGKITTQDLVLENVEALANDESVKITCIGRGNIDCIDFDCKVKYII